MIKKILACCGFLLAVVGYSANQLTWEDLRKNIDSWIEGPVSLIATDQEKSVFERLKTPEEKMQFIKIFWARRDPLLRTSENEFKQHFFDRVDYANANYAEGDTDGWKTARGQVYILFGPPSREEKRVLPESSRPALLWVYDKIPSHEIPKNEALLFIWRDIKYVLAPPNAEPGDVFAERQREFDSAFRYQTIPSVVQQAFNDVKNSSIEDPQKDYRMLLTSVKTTEKFNLAGINFDMELSGATPPTVQVRIPAELAPVYDAGNEKFAELYFKQQLKKGDTVVADSDSAQSYSWNADAFDDLKQITYTLPQLKVPAGAGEYMLYVTVGDRISNISETKKIGVKY